MPGTELMSGYKKKFYIILSVVRALRHYGADVRYRVILGGEHHEKSRSRRFGRILSYL